MKTQNTIKYLYCSKFYPDEEIAILEYYPEDDYLETCCETCLEANTLPSMYFIPQNTVASWSPKLQCTHCGECKPKSEIHSIMYLLEENHRETVCKSCAEFMENEIVNHDLPSEERRNKSELEQQVEDYEIKLEQISDDIFFYSAKSDNLIVHKLVERREVMRNKIHELFHEINKQFID